MKQSQKIIIRATVIIFGFFTAYVMLYFPTSWRNVDVGMTSFEVVALLGKPQFDTGEIKGVFWYYGKPPSVFILNVHFDKNNKVKNIDIKQHIGSSEFSYVREIR